MDLTEDLVFDIIRYLPFKLAIQCKCLNKNFRTLISLTPNLHAPLSNDQPVLFSVFTRLEIQPHSHRVLGANPEHNDHHPSKIIENYYRISPYSLHVKNDQPSYVYSNPSRSFTVIMSSLYSGRILLQLFDNSYCIFNPVTGGYFVIPKSPSMSRFEAVVGLVDEVSSPHYKLVAVMSDSSSLRRLEVAVFESEHNSWRQRMYRTRDIGRRLTEFNPHNRWNLSQPVYVHGCLHFARQDGFILVFDVKPESLRIMDKPNGVDYTNYPDFYTMWFGEVGGSLVLALAYTQRIVICVHDSVGNEWRSKTIINQDIHTLIHGPSPDEPIDYCDGDDRRSTVIHDPSHVLPIYCDKDDNLFLMTEEFDIYRYKIYRCKIKEDASRKIGNLGMSEHIFPRFYPFVPTLVDIPGCKYLKSDEKIKLKFGEEEERQDHEEVDAQGLWNLQSLLLGPSNISVSKDRTLLKSPQLPSFGYKSQIKRKKFRHL